jgi:thiamine-phosphate pyrophosphorylase
MEHSLASDRLLIVTDRSQAYLPFPLLLQDVIKAGGSWISLREKNLSYLERCDLLRQLQDYSASVFLTLHGPWDEQPLPPCVRGIHLPAGHDVRSMRQRIGKDLRIGLSVHASDRLDYISAEDVDYLMAGPLFPSQSKPGYGPPLGEKGLEALVKQTSLPVWAIGGITPKTVPAALRAGAYGVAVMGSIMRDSNPKSLVQDLIEAIYD